MTVNARSEGTGRPARPTCYRQSKEAALALEGVVVLAALPAVAALQVEQQRPGLLYLLPQGQPDALCGLPPPTHGIHLLKGGSKLHSSSHQVISPAVADFCLYIISATNAEECISSTAVIASRAAHCLKSKKVHYKAAEAAVSEQRLCILMYMVQVRAAEQLHHTAKFPGPILALSFMGSRKLEVWV